MTNEEREKLIEDMLRAYFQDRFGLNGMRAALAIAEAAIRKDCAEIAKKAPAVICDNAIDYVKGVKKIVAAALASIPEKKDDRQENIRDDIV